MNRNRKTLGFYFAFLVAFFQVTGIMATESLWNLPVDQSSESAEIVSAEGHRIWASEEIIQQIKLPEYSENQFYGPATPGTDPGNFRERKQPGIRPCILHSDLRSLLTSLIYPFHFFH